MTEMTWRDGLSLRVLRKRSKLGRLFGKPSRAHFFSHGRLISVEHRGTAADSEVVKQCFSHEQYRLPSHVTDYDAAADRFAGDVSNNGRQPLILDLGANIGASVAWFAARYPSAAIAAVEPATDNFMVLTRNVSHLASVRTYLAGVSGQDGQTRLLDSGHGAWGYRTDPDGEGESVKLLRIKTILEDYPADRFVPFILKIDIEGAEKTLFDTDQDALASFPVIIIEPHDWLMPGEMTSRGFFRFHSQQGRDFSYHSENIFSLDWARLGAASTGEETRSQSFIERERGAPS
jgi:FkbM family methyltransferase